MNGALTLYELQERFTHCLLDNSLPADTLPLDTANASTNDKRLDIYRNNVFFSLKNALADLYPVFKRLTGDEFFNGAGVAYLKQHPPTKAAMVYFGSNFPDFIEQFEHTKEHKWLADVARLELACHQSYHEADVKPLDPATLIAISPERLADMQIKLHPSIRLITSPFPVYKIWLANQGEAENDETIDLDSGGEMLYAYRPEYDVLIKKLDKGTYTFLARLAEGDSLGTAIVTATNKDHSFSADKALADCLNENLFENIVEVK